MLLTALITYSISVGFSAVYSVLKGENEASLENNIQQKLNLISENNDVIKQFHVKIIERVREMHYQYDRKIMASNTYTEVLKEIGTLELHQNQRSGANKAIQSSSFFSI